MKNNKFVVKYLVNGTLKGYHIDTFCHVGEKNKAKIYDDTDPVNQVKIIGENLKSIWDDFKAKERETWKGCSLDQIQIVTEFID